MFAEWVSCLSLLQTLELARLPVCPYNSTHNREPPVASVQELAKASSFPALPGYRCTRGHRCRCDPQSINAPNEWSRLYTQLSPLHLIGLRSTWSTTRFSLKETGLLVKLIRASVFTHFFGRYTQVSPISFDDVTKRQQRASCSYHEATLEIGPLFFPACL